ncbi:LOW QUALITY PROTEIN: hypothetical protein JCM18905_1924 [Vibrio sp. JCM 18905]|nr:LOW QUALITY PROTEIN: hypothetical protein JCM18905_1924 [Vibrio sp. JCM 18905]
MNSEAKQLFSYLCKQYDVLSQELESRAFPEFSETITHRLDTALSVALLAVSAFPLLQSTLRPPFAGKVVLTAFIDYIKSHPYHYQGGVEVAIIENKNLAKRLLSLGWKYKSLFSKIFFANKPTLVKDFQSA